jgi:hypothetical protein
MHPKLRTAGLLSLFLLGAATSFLVAHRRDVPAAVPKQVRDLAGTFTGAWTLYGVDDKGAVVKRMAWTDTVKAEDPQVKGDRAFVTVADEITFDGGKIPPFKVKGTEGYFLNKDGGLGDYFVEFAGKLNRMVKLADSVSTYAAPADALELGQMGFPKGASGQHVLVKVVTTEEGVETHRITRVTTAKWTGKDGKERWQQFVSLHGFHKRWR